MAGRTRVVTIRLKQGGVLMVAPAAILPWPRALTRSARHLQPQGLSRALNDPNAMQMLRTEYPQLVNMPIARAFGLLSNQQLIAAYQRAADRGLLTIVFGHTEASYAERRPGQPLQIVFQNNPVIAEAARAMVKPGVNAQGGLPPPGTPIPNGYEERLMWTVARSAVYIDPADFLRFKEFFDPEALGVTVAILAIWAGSHVVGVGFVVDAALFAHAIWQNGHTALKAFDELKTFFDLTRSPGSWSDLDQAAKSFAIAVTALGAVALRQLMRRVGNGASVRGGTETGGATVRSGAAATKKTPVTKEKAEAAPAKPAPAKAAPAKPDPPKAEPPKAESPKPAPSSRPAFLKPKKMGEREPGAAPLSPGIKRAIAKNEVRKAGPPQKAEGMPDLPASEAATFRGGAAKPQDYPEGTKFYRVIDGDSNPNGSYWTTEKPTTEAGWRSSAAVKNNWNGDGGYVTSTAPPGGVKLWSGPSAPQLTSDGKAALPGGGHQIWAPRGANPLKAGEAQPTPWNGGS